MKGSSDKVIREVFEGIGVQINGDRLWDIRVHNKDFYDKVLSRGSIGFGESYMDSWWDCKALDQVFDRILRAGLDRKVKDKRMLPAVLKAKIINSQKRSRAYVVGERHYDIGNRLFSVMLDKRMNYSCGYWDKAKTLDEAQVNKLDLICRKLSLEPGMTVLDIGCGWGGFARFAAGTYGVSVLGITVSREQVKFAQEYCQGYDVGIKLQDYRELPVVLNKKFDRIVSVGMIEHVGYKNYRTYMEVVNRCLKENGLFLLQTIAGNTSEKSAEPWVDKYIFPNSMLPSAKQISKASEGLLMLEDWHSFGEYYDRTMMHWYLNFVGGWDDLKHLYDYRFFRMWTYYLLAGAGSFRSRKNQLWQIVFSKNGINCDNSVLLKRG